MKKNLVLMLCLILIAISSFPAMAFGAITVNQNSSSVLVNGALTGFEAYTIKGNNYFKLRDIAKVVSGTEKQFDVSWDNANSAINLISGSSYTTVGGELLGGNGLPKTAILNSSRIYKDGSQVSLSAYTINGNNFFKLRDLTQTFDIGVDWDSATSTIAIDTTKSYSDQPQENLDMVSGPEFMDAASVKKIATGHTFMDIYNTYLFQNRLTPSISSMDQNNASWVVYDNYNSYHQMDPPIIGTYPNPSPHTFRNASEKELETMIKTAHDKGLKFALMSELNYDVAKGPFTTWEENQAFWEESAAILTQMGQNLGKATEQQNIYWDEWFRQYTNFILSNAVAAENYGADMLLIGKQIEGAIRQENTSRWEALIRQVRQAYSGPISYAAWTSNEYTQLQDAGFLSSLDYITIYMYNPIASSQNPNVAELKESFETILDKQAAYYYQKTGKKIILLTPFQSRTFGAKQEWFEPAAPAPDVQRDDLIQAKIYEALFQAIADEEYIEAVWTWGYWWLENDFNREDGSPASFDKSSSVRNKPAAEVIRKWSE